MRKYYIYIYDPFQNLNVHNAALGTLVVAVLALCGQQVRYTNKDLSFGCGHHQRLITNYAMMPPIRPYSIASKQRKANR